MKLHFAADVNSSNFISISNAVSRLNRRFYRQGLNWAVAGFKVLTDSNSGITISKVPNTWVASQAWKKAFEAWNDQQMEAIEDMGGESGLAAFRDFKVYADGDHVTAGFGANILPEDLATAQYAPGEWQSSQIVIPNNAGVPGNTVEYYVQMTGASSAAAKAAIAGYEFSRAYPSEPDPQTPAMATSWLNVMNDVGSNNDEIVTNAIDRNDNLPYPQIGYPGGGTQAPTLELHDLADITATTVGASTRLKGGSFPCGLIRIDLKNRTAGTATFAFTIDLVPGTHRGYMAESMLEM